MSNDPVLYDVPRERVARITLNRPEMGNAQDTELLYRLNDAFDRAAQDDDISVIVLAANGRHFSAGHDLRERDYEAHMAEHSTVGTWCGFGCVGAEAQMAREKELYLGLSERWRNVPKPTIAAVQGKVIAGGLMLVWPCDIIIAAEDATFSDPAVDMGVSGVEFFAHPWEFGARKAKELLFTAATITAVDAEWLGMVNKVVPNESLLDEAIDLADSIAQRPLFALKLAKEAVNASQDAQGRVAGMQTAFALHQLCHSHNTTVHGLPIDPGFMKRAFPKKAD